MSTELICLGWTLVLAIVQVLAASMTRTAKVGLDYNAGPRDGPPPVQPGPVAGRLARAQSNLYETLPLFAAAVLGVLVAQKAGPLSAYGAIVYLAGRVVYLPLYALGIPKVRSLVWAVSMVGLGMVIVALLR